MPVPASAPPPLPCYILAGPETGKRTSFVKDIVDSLAKTDGAVPEYHKLYCGDTPTEEIVGLLQNGSLFSSRRVFECRNAEAITVKSDISALVAYLASPAEDAVLLLVTETYSLAKPIETAAGASAKKIFWELRDFEKPAWIKERLSHYRLSIDDEAVEAILELVENETSALDAACTMLAACFPAGSRIRMDDAEAVLSKSRQEDAFSLFDRLAGSDLSSALAVLDTVLADRQSDATQIVAALVWSFRKLERLQIAVSRGLSADEAFRQEKIASKTGQKKFKTAMQRFSAEDCQRIIRAVSETEGALRSGLAGSFERPLLHLLLHSIMTRKGRGLILSGWKEEEYYQFD